MRTPDSECCTPFLKALGDKTRWRIVQELLSSPVTVSELAAAVYVSETQLRRIFQAARQTSPKAVLTAWRIEQAKTELAAGRRSVSA